MSEYIVLYLAQTEDRHLAVSGVAAWNVEAADPFSAAKAVRQTKPELRAVDLATIPLSRMLHWPGHPSVDVEAERIADAAEQRHWDVAEEEFGRTHD